MRTKIVKGTGTNYCRSHRGRPVCKDVVGRHSQKKDNSSIRVHRSDFLKHRFEVIPAKHDIAEAIKEFLTEDNSDYLLKCAVHYAELLGKTIEIPTGAVHERINRLYYCFAGILPEKHRLNIEIFDNKLAWTVYYVHDWQNYFFYWLPVNFITRLSGCIREIAMSFIHLYIKKNNLLPFRYCYEYEYIFEVAEYSDYYYDDDYTEVAISELLHSYCKGEISVFLDELYNHEPLDVISELHKYKPHNSQEIKLLDCFKKGLPFIAGNDSIMNYHYDPYFEGFPEEYEDVEPVSLDRIIRYVYDINDFVSDELVQITNQHEQEAYTLKPTSFLILRPDTDLFRPSDYPERFSNWFLEMIEIIEIINKNE